MLLFVQPYNLQDVGHVHSRNYFSQKKQNTKNQTQPTTKQNPTFFPNESDPKTNEVAQHTANTDSTTASFHDTFR